MQVSMDQRRIRQMDLVGVDQRGFTLVETSIAMVVLMVAALASVSVFAYSIRNNSGAQDRELAMAVAQHQLEQLRNVSFTDASLTATAGITTTVTRAGRQYIVTKSVTDANTVAGQPTIKNITIRVTPVGTGLGTVILVTQRGTLSDGPYR